MTTTPVTDAASAQTTKDASNSTTNTSTSKVTETMFLQLLVAQLKNQDPLNPADGTEFLSQMAQFSQLEQLIGIRQDLEKGLGMAASSDQ